MRTNKLAECIDASNIEKSSGIHRTGGHVHGAGLSWTARHGNRLVERLQPIVDTVDATALELKSQEHARYKTQLNAMLVDKFDSK